MRIEVETSDYWVGFVQQDDTFTVSLVVKNDCSSKQYIMNQAESFLSYLKEKIAVAKTA